MTVANFDRLRHGAKTPGQEYARNAEMPLTPNIARIAPDELRKTDGNRLAAARKVYLAEIETLGSGARGDEFRRLQQAWRKIDREPAPSDTASEEFRYVLHADVARFEAEGWEPLSALTGSHHGEYSVLMRRQVAG